MYYEDILKHSLKLKGSFVHVQGAEKYNVPRSTIIPKPAWLFRGFRKKNNDDFDSRKNSLCFVGNHAGFGRNQFLE